MFFQGLRIQNILYWIRIHVERDRTCQKGFGSGASSCVLDPILENWTSFALGTFLPSSIDWNPWLEYTTRKESIFSMSSFVIISKFCYSQQGSERLNTKRPTLVFFLGNTKPLLSPAPAIQCSESREMTFRGEKGSRRQKIHCPFDKDSYIQPLCERM